MERLNRVLLLTAALLLMAFPAFSQGTLNGGGGDDPADPTVIEFEKLEYDLGTFKAGEPVKAHFTFKNAGDADLIVETVKPSCSCTALTWTEKPIKPGGTGVIDAEIDTADMEGEKEKSFAVMYNGNPPVERVVLKFTVLAAEGAAPQGDADGDGIK
jgi:hypothetical protein